MTTRRTRRERDADRIDLELFRAIGTADEHGKNSMEWRNIARAMRAARTFVRMEMHPADRDISEERFVA